MKRAISVSKVLEMQFQTMAFEGRWKDSFGIPESNGSWLIWGQSGSGKTRFSMMLAKYLCQFGHVVYDSLEEGLRMSMQKVIRETAMHEVKDRFKMLDREPIEQLKIRLRRRRSPDIIFIDSFQYAQLRINDYRALKNEFPNKLFIFISHADGKSPSGRTAKSVQYDVDVKVYVHGFKAIPKSRFEGNKPFVIWPEGAAEFYGE